MLRCVHGQNFCAQRRRVDHDDTRFGAFGCYSHRLEFSRARGFARLSDEDDDFFGEGNIQLVSHFDLIEVLDALVDLKGPFLPSSIRSLTLRLSRSIFVTVALTFTTSTESIPRSVAAVWACTACDEPNAHSNIKLKAALITFMAFPFIVELLATLVHPAPRRRTC